MPKFGHILINRILASSWNQFYPKTEIFNKKDILKSFLKVDKYSIGKKYSIKKILEN